MSLIKCPKCGNEISNQTRECIYCGAKLFHCPKCGKIMADGRKACPNCGYELPATPKPVSVAKPQPASQSVSEINLIKEWEAACPAEVTRRKAIGGVRALAIFAAEIPIVIYIAHLLGLIYPLNEKTPFEDFLNCSNFINNTFTASIILCCVAIVVSSVMQYWRVSLINNWLKQGTFDIAGYLKSQDSFIFGKDTDAYWAIYCACSPKGKIHFALYCLAGSAGPISSIIISMLLRYIAIERWENLFLGTEFAFSFPWKPFVIVGVIFVLLLIPVLISEHACKKFLKSYTQS